MLVTQDVATESFSLSVVLPAFNETHRLPETLKALKAYLHEHFLRHEVIVVDDGSSDGTPDLVRQWQSHWPELKLLVQPHNMGKGAAVRRGMLAATCDLVMFTDADLATPMTELDHMLKYFRTGFNKAVVGVRTYQQDESKWRRILGLSLQIIAHLIVFEHAVVDSQCGLKCLAVISRVNCSSSSVLPVACSTLRYLPLCTGATWKSFINRYTGPTRPDHASIFYAACFLILSI